jgi:integrase
MPGPEDARIGPSPWPGANGTYVEQARHAGLPPIRLHDLRHTWATLALSAGEHPKVVQERLGHAAIAITLDVYSHVTEGLHGDAASRVAGIIFGTGVSTPVSKGRR